MKEIIPKDIYKIVVSGDSISKGVIYNEDTGKYTITSNNYVSLIQDKIKGIVCNAAKFGSTIIKGISKLQSEIAKNNPDIVLIEYGGNDCDFDWEDIARNPKAAHNPKTDVKLFRQMLYNEVSALKSKGIIPVLMTLPPLDADRYFKWISKNSTAIANNILEWLGSVNKIYWWHEMYNSVIVNIAEETKTKWIDIRGAFLQTADFTRLLCIDGIHPNEEGHKLIASKIFDYIKSNYGFMLKDGAVLSFE
jgi:lysophospholipase L1-like esterase